MAEFDEYHDQKVEDFEELTKDFLDGEIQLYEQVRKSPHLTLYYQCLVFKHLMITLSSSYLT